MKYAIISDIHANASALRHVLKDAATAGAQQIVCLGDIVGYGPQPCESVNLIRQHASIVLAGNHDDAVSGRCRTDDFIPLAADAVVRHRQMLGHDDLCWLRHLPYSCRFDGAEAVHGDFLSPESFAYVSTVEQAAANFKQQSSSLLFVGHTHTPGFFLTGESGRVYSMEPQDFMLEAGKRYLVNPGSVGYPRATNGVCLSSYVLYDSDAKAVFFRYLPFSVSSVMQRGKLSGRGLLSWSIVGILAASAVFGLAVRFLPPSTVQKTPLQPQESEEQPQQIAALEERMLSLVEGNRYVRPNLKLAHDSPPVELVVDFKSATGQSLESKRSLVKSSARRKLKIPANCIEVRFTLLKVQAEDSPCVQSFQPTAEE